MIKRVLMLMCLASGGLCRAEEVTTVSISQGLSNCWNQVTTMSGILRTKASFQDWPVFDDEVSSVPLEIVNGDVSDEMTSFTISSDVTIIEMDWKRRGQTRIQNAKQFVGGRVTNIRRDITPILYEVSSGKVEDGDLTALTVYFSLIGAFPKAMQLSEDRKERYAVIPIRWKSRSNRVEEQYINGQKSLVVWDGKERKVILEKDTLTPLKAEWYNAAGDVTQSVFFGDFLKVPGSEVRMPTRVEVITRMEVIEGHQPIQIRQLSLEEILFNNDVPDGRKRLIIPNGAIEVSQNEN
ncbi:MAG: hypothetical protein K1X53_08560 [Candidatus Sumerlaeaceae bacterium]|nr:hypothetical protein [Candidatus Sumerlaeaceae bacterium]